MSSVIATFAFASAPAFAQNGPPLDARPFTFIGTAADCGAAGSRIVTAAWLDGMGLPDNGGVNTTAADLTTNPNKQDPHMGLLLSKNGPTPDCSAAGAAITGLPKQGTTLTELGFDYRNGGHCGAGAPRFNVTTSSGLVYFFGCASGPSSPAPQDPLEWTRVRFTAAEAAPQTAGQPAFVFGAGGTAVTGISIVYDEGTDAPSAQDPNGVGLAVLDNIDVNGTLITHGSNNNGNGNGNGSGNSR